MSDDTDDKIIPINRPSVSMSFKKIDYDSKRALCKHKHIEIWPKEPIIECRDCSAIVDPYQWIRQTISEWENWSASYRYRVAELKREEESLKKSIKWLRGEYADEREKREMERAVMVLPPHIRGR